MFILEVLFYNVKTKDTSCQFSTRTLSSSGHPKNFVIYLEVSNRLNNIKYLVENSSEIKVTVVLHYTEI